jgi:predicted O-methyltransferase YrrM
MADAILGTASLSYVENWLDEDEPLQTARRHADELGTCVPIGAGGGMTLRFLAASIAARAVVEVGTGCGTSGLWLLRGMRPDGVLTTVDVEPEHQRFAREAYLSAGIAANRFRMIRGQAADVLPRLTDGGYDLVFVDADKASYPDYLVQAIRLLRPGGVVAFDNALRRDRVAEPSAHDSDTTTTRELLRTVRDDAGLIPALLPVGDGLLVAVKSD